MTQTTVRLPLDEPAPQGAAPVATTRPGESSGLDGLLGLLLQRDDPRPRAPEPAGVVIGELIALADNGQTPLLALPGHEGTAVPALSIVDLHGAHIGQRVAVLFESAVERRPLVIGVLRGAAGPMAPEAAGVEVDADGRRYVLSAQEQLVLRCGKASITLTRAGKVLIEGEYVLSRSAGVNRVKGGSVQLN